METHRAIDAVWRIEAPRLIAGLTRIVRDVGVAEDLAQDALIAALEKWPASGVPDNPGAWLMATAKHRAIDHLRRNTLLERKHGELGYQIDAQKRDTAAELNESLDDEVGDDLLRLVFISCHPVLATEARVALTLRLLGGLTTDEIARAFLTAEATIAQRIVRAKRTLAKEQVPFEVPRGPELEARLASVLEVIYLIFNEGYSATAGDDWMRPALCEDALRLGRVVAELVPAEPEVHGLVALMEIQASRAKARIDATGAPILLLDQNRALWDQLLIHRGLAALDRATGLGGASGRYALQAAIAACHAVAPTGDDTDWARIADLYGELAALMPSPVVELNRAVAVGMADGPQAGLDIVERIAGTPALSGYHLLPSVRGDLLAKLGRHDEARQEFEKAAALTRNVRERDLLLERARANLSDSARPDRLPMKRHSAHAVAMRTSLLALATVLGSTLVLAQTPAPAPSTPAQGGPAPAAPVQAPAAPAAPGRGGPPPPLPPGATRDPFPTPIETTAGLVTVDYVEFATVPDINMTPARMMLLVDEPGTKRMFVNDMRGPIYSVSYDGKSVQLYVDTNDAKWGVPVQSMGNERGLQSYAFHPQFAQPNTPGYGKFYTYADTSNMEPAPDFRPLNAAGNTHDTVLLEWTAKSPAAATYDGGAPRELMRFEQPFANHNAGHLTFNPLARPGAADFGLLYMGSADGGSGGDPLNLAQNMSSAFGKILRIDPLGKNSANGKYGIPASNPFVNDNKPETLGEIYASGLRNPQRFAWDSKTGNFFVADIGQNIVEKISLVTSGANLGWNKWEGSYAFLGNNGGVSTENVRSDPSVTYPVAEYGQVDPLLQNNSAATMGVVYRGTAIKQLSNLLIFGDNPSGELFYVSADTLPRGGQDAIRRILLNDKGTAKTLLQLIQEKNTAQGRTPPATRVDLRFGPGANNQIFLLNKRDGIIRLLVPTPGR